MSNLEAIDAYLNGLLPPSDRAAFEARLKAEPALAEDLAFFLQTRQVAREAALAERHAEWASLRRQATRARQVRVLYTAAASLAAVLLLVLGWWSVFRKPATTPETLAEAYFQENFATLPVLMSGNADTLQRAIGLANEGKAAAALALLDAALRQNPANSEAKKLAGLVALRAGNYDQAIGYFQSLARQPGLYTNPGTFHEALARLKRGRPLDQKEAERLLQTVVRENLEGKEEAVKWLAAWE